MDVRAKQRLCFLACPFPSRCVVAVSPHVISSVRRFLCDNQVCLFLHTAAGLNITAGDLAKWDIALSTGKIIKPSSMNEMYAPAKLNNGETFDYGGGWAIHQRPRHSSVGHSGGYSAAYERFLDDKITVVVLTNLSGADPDSLVDGIAAIYIPSLKQNAK